MPLNPESTTKLELRISELEGKIKKLEEHQHLGRDGSRVLNESTDLKGKSILISGAGKKVGPGESFVQLPSSIADGDAENINKKRVVSNGIVNRNLKEALDEQVLQMLTVGKVSDEEDLKPLNRVDWDKLNYAQLILHHFPQNTGSSGVFSPFSFLTANRTPFPSGTGRIITGESTITDSAAKFTVNALVDCFVNLNAGTLETRRIVSNTETEITVEGTWEAAEGDYLYDVMALTFLGAANVPFSRLFVGEDIRLGYGASGGSQVRFIKWGTGTPEGSVTANIGSIFLRFDGGTSTTLYVKTSGNGLATGWTAK
jgi:hypothetical protein